MWATTVELLGVVPFLEEFRSNGRIAGMRDGAGLQCRSAVTGSVSRCAAVMSTDPLRCASDLIGQEYAVPSFVDLGKCDVVAQRVEHCLADRLCIRQQGMCLIE